MKTKKEIKIINKNLGKIVEGTKMMLEGLWGQKVKLVGISLYFLSEDETMLHTRSYFAKGFNPKNYG